MHIDPILKSGNGTTMLELWGGNETINNVTVYEVLHMKGGLGDYDDGAMLRWTLANPDKDFDPWDYLYTIKDKFICLPGTCEYYSSPGYSLLAFVAAAHHNATSWDKFDQMSMFPDWLQKSFNETFFMGRGKCSNYSNVTH